MEVGGDACGGGLPAANCTGSFGGAFAFGFMGLGPGGLFLLSRTWLAELLLFRPPGDVGGLCGPPPYGPGLIERGCCPKGRGDIERGDRSYDDGPGELRPLAGDIERGTLEPVADWTGGLRRFGGGAPRGATVPAGRGLTGRVDRHVRGATPC